MAMPLDAAARPSRTFTVLVVVALLWNLLGCVAVMGDLMLSPADLAALPPGQQAMAAARPGWSILGSLLAVGGGVLGCVLLLLRKSAALSVLAVSLLGVLAQDTGLLIAAGGIAGLDPVVIVLQGVVLAVAIALLLAAHRATRGAVPPSA